MLLAAAYKWCIALKETEKVGRAKLYKIVKSVLARFLYRLNGEEN